MTQVAEGHPQSHRRSRHHPKVEKPEGFTRWRCYCKYCGHSGWHTEWREALLDACVHSWLLK